MAKIMKILLFFVFLVSTWLSFSLNAESAYIYDKDKPLWSLAGASKDFRVEFKYPPGTKLQIIAGEVENGYTHVIDAKGRKSWIPSNYLLPSANVFLDKALDDIEKQKSIHQRELKRLQAELSAKAPLEKINQKLQSKIARMQIELNILKQSNSAISNRFNREVFFAGGLTIFIGILFGWIFGVRGRKRNDAWS